MKVIFLDIDGVLNSYIYDRERLENDGNIDRTRLVILKELVDKTDAKIVLSSSWRNHWDKDQTKCDEIGQEIASDFASAGLEIYDKTPKLGYLERSEEIKLWLKDKTNVEKFVIFDDNGYNWKELSDNFIQTNYRIGRGLEKEHIKKAIELLS